MTGTQGQREAHAPSREKKTYGKGSAWFKGGVHVLSLRGTYEEMAAQHGGLLKNEIQNGALPYLGTKNSDLVRHSHIFENRPWLQKLALGAIRNFIHRPMLAQAPRHYLEEARALSKTAEIPYEYCQESLVQADTLTLLIRYFMGRYVLGHLGTGFPGCTSVVAMKNASKTGGIIHARNMDYPVVGRWDAYPVVAYCDPEGSDSGQRYVSITSAGIHTAGVTSLNESGLTLSAHFHCAKAVSPFGMPVQFIGSEIMKNARSIGQAIDILRDIPRAATWGFVLSSADENNAVVIEMTHDKISVREPVQDMLMHTNHFHTPEFHEREVLLSAGIAQDFVRRHDRASELMKKHHGRIDRQTMAQILGDHFDLETGKLRSQGNTISVVTTVTSMIAESSERRFWIGNSGESPTCLGNYAGFSLSENFERFEEREPEIFRWSTEGAVTIKNTVKHESFRLFRDAYIAFHTEYDVKKAAQMAEKAAQADGEEGHFHLAHGHCRMRLGQVEKAYEAFRAASKCVLSPHMAQVTKVFTGHALDCLERRQEALECYQTIAKEAISPQLVKEAKRCLKRPYKIDRAARITFDMQFCDSLEFA